MDDVKQIIINKRSGVIHTRDCESVKQMKGSNKDIEFVNDISQIEDTKPCGHCLKKRDLKKIYTMEYERKKKILEEKRDYEHRQIDFKYEGKLAKLEANFKEKIMGLPDD
ncbi:hypothetical protein [Methanosphaera stadtmanae]|uniref:hypothetical protein n=1 Tax=Methanosphaera stadtmanae TaxID=2317 RepID=UPI0026668415|nr:hypothetical protein [Methanosphaera stadtmanae]